MPVKVSEHIGIIPINAMYYKTSILSIKINRIFREVMLPSASRLGSPIIDDPRVPVLS